MAGMRMICAVAVVAAVFCAGETKADAWDTNHKIDYDLTGNYDIALGSGLHVAVLQRAGDVNLTGGCAFGRYTDSAAAYLLEGGSLQVNQFTCYGSYSHFRLSGGNLTKLQLYRTASWAQPDSVPADFVFGGDSALTNNISTFIGSFRFAVMDGVYVNDAYSAGNKCDGMWIGGTGDAAPYTRTICLNGGYLVANTTSGSINFYAFNGGTLGLTYGSIGAFGIEFTKAQTSDPVLNAVAHSMIRVYERGGCVRNESDTYPESSRNVSGVPAFKEPEGNVVWSIPIPLDHPIRDMTFEIPPSVEIVDSTGSGTNAAAIADWDYDSGKVTNFTVICRGDNYSGAAGAVTANLRYKAGDKLLGENPLVCTVGPCQGGDMTFSGGPGFYFRAYTTNSYHGATIVDMDRNGIYDSATNEAGKHIYGPYSKGFLSVLNSCQFLNTTSVVIKSGMLHSGSSANFGRLFPQATRLELYGGYMSRFYSSAVDTVVVGGVTVLNNRRRMPKEEGFPSYAEDAGHHPTYLTVNETLYVDPACIAEKGITPALSKGEGDLGSLTLKSGAKVAVKDWSTLPKGKRIPILDLSGIDLTIQSPPVADTPNLVASEEGVLSWDKDEKVLYARRRADGWFMIFK